MKRTNWIGFIPFYLLVVILFLGLAAGGSRTVTTVAENSPLERGVTVIIDAGHGGIDGGATSCTGVLESALNLQIAQRLECLLQLLGYETLMLRNGDYSIHTEGETIAAIKVSDLKERVRIVNSTENALLVSIHQNTFPQEKYSGAQVFYSPKGEGRTLASQLQSALVTSLNPGSNRKSKPSDGVYLMQHIECTGVLVECGFLSNPAEEAKLRDSGYQQQLVCVIGSTLSRFIDP